VTTTDLPTLMRAKADADGLPADHDLRQKADALETAAAGFYATTQTHTVAQMVGAWARARRTWCDYTGEPLL
jgi:hypothetical protein